MENITLAAYLEKNPESKRLKKRIARALKNYIHASKDIIHAADDLSHAKEDCSAALQAAADIIEDHRDLLEDWTNPQEESVTAIELDKEAEETASEDEDACECNGHDCGPSEEVGCHLRHAAKDIANALRDAESAIDCLDKAEDLLLEIISIAEKDGFAIAESEAKAYIIQKGKESAANRAAASEKAAKES